MNRLEAVLYNVVRTITGACNFLDTTDPMCLSENGIETTIHFMLLCQEYAIHRTVLFGKVAPICASYGVYCNMLNDEELLALILYDNDAFNTISNESILSATIFYINSTNRLHVNLSFYFSVFIYFIFLFLYRIYSNRDQTHI